MTALPWPDHLLSLEEWDQLPEDNSRHFELVDGVLIVAPRAAPHHNIATGNLMVALNRQLPLKTLAATHDSEVVIDSRYPATVRAPDVLITSTSRIREKPSRLDAADVLLAVEIISPSSHKTDRIVKPAEYAEAGIPHYWVIDLEEPASLSAFTLVDGAYEVVLKEETGKVRLYEPVTITIDVSRLAEPGYH